MSARPTTNHKERIVHQLAHDHFEAEPTLERVIWLRGEEPDGEIHLLHVDSSAIPADATGPAIFRFTPTADVPYALRLAQVTPDEWEAIKAGSLALPNGWTAAERREFDRPEAHR